jgi:fibronectin type 3 domain-containing protein
MIRKACLALSLFALFAAVTAAPSSARTTNVAQLDDGTCGRNLQLGSDKTASSSATPTFLLWGDGGLSSYAAFIDGAPIGTFNSDGLANVCITTSVPLADGPHVLTANELRPNTTFAVVPFNFSVDTVRPAQPSTPVISSFSDSGLLGDHITRFRGVNFTGFSDANISIQLYNGVTLLGGALASTSGAWSATTSQLPDGDYLVTAAAFDQAGNKSMLSLSAAVTVDGTPPTGGITNPTNGAVVSGTVPVTTNGSDAHGIWKVDYQVDSGTKTTIGASPFTFSWNTAGLANGAHTLTATIHDLPDNTVVNTITVNVQNGSATAPGAPTLNSATGGNGSATLNWTAPASSGGSAITGYKVYRATTSGGETLLTTLGNVTSWADGGLTNGAPYYYKVTALNAVGESPPSNEVSAVPAGAPGPPTLAATAASSGSVALSWNAPSSNGGAGITGYRVYRGTASGGEILLTTLGALTSWTDTGLVNGTTYYYRVTALNSIGESSLSNELSATPTATAAVTVPGAPTLNPATAGNTTIALSWSAPASNGGSPITGYKVYRGTASGGETLLTTVGLVTSLVDATGIVNGTTYYYKVSAVNAAGESTRSNEASAIPAGPPGAPTLTSATAANGSVALAWSSPASNGGSGVTGYRIYRGTTSGGETLLTTLGAVSSFTDAGVVNGTAYYYKVSALNSVGEGTLSNEQLATPAASATVPAAPTLNSATAGVGSVALTWSAPASDGGSAVTGYNVWRATTSGGETLLATVGNVASFTDTAVVNGTTYYYKVGALNAIGQSALSGERFATPTAAATIPGAPTLSSATGSSASIALAWTAPASNGGSAVSGYKVWRATTSGGEALLTSLANVTGWTDTAVTNGTTYYYKVTAVNGIGQSVFSNEKFATLAGTGPSAPGAPTLSSATGGNASVVLAWSAPASDGGASITGYRIYRGTTSGAQSLLATTGNLTGYTDTSLTNGTTYFYKVAAVNAAGEGALSSERSAIPATVPNPPTLAPSGAGSGQVSLSWTPPPSNGGSAVTGYKVYRSTASGAETLLVTLGNVTGYNDSAVTNGTTYYYKVTAVNALGESLLSGEQAATPTASATAPGAPTLASATAGNSSVAIVWNAPASNGGSAITGYRIYRGTASGAEILLTTLGNVTLFNDSGLANGTTYFYKVAAVNALGEGAASAERSATPATTPGAPTLNSAVPGNSVTLTWSLPAANGGMAVTGYRIYRGTTIGGETFLTSVGLVTSYTDTTTTPGTTYYFKVTALNAIGESSMSNELAATPSAADTTPPSAPTNVTVPVVGSSQAVVGWTASTDNAGVTGYQVYRDGFLVGNVVTTHYLDTGMSAGSTHSYQVRALDGAGLQSALSTSRSALLEPLGKNAQATLSGIVYDNSGRPLPNVPVTLTQSGTVKTATTGIDGVWTVGKLSAGSYAVSARPAGFQGATFTMNAASHETLLAVTTLP